MFPLPWLQRFGSEYLLDAQRDRLETHLGKLSRLSLLPILSARYQPFKAPHFDRSTLRSNAQWHHLLKVKHQSSKKTELLLIVSPPAEFDQQSTNLHHDQTH